jgi:hypothetical protein
MSYITVKVKIKPYLKDFLVHINGREDEQGNRIVLASKKNITGFYIFPLLEKAPEHYRPLHGDPARILEIRLPYLKEFNVRYNNHVSEVGMRHFQSAIENIFLAEFFRDVSHALNTIPGKKIKDAILDFCYAYQISFDNITFEMLRKKYTRYKFRLKEVKQDGVSVPRRYVRVKDRVA